MMGHVSHVNQAFLDGVWEAEEPSNLPADLRANISFLHLLSLNRGLP